MKSTSSPASAFKDQPFIATIRPAKFGCCSMGCCVPRVLVEKDGVSYKWCPKCNDAQEIPPAK